MSSSQCFYKQLAYFSRDFEIFAPDLKGFGKNTNMPYPYSLDDYISEVKEYMDKNKLDNPFLIAHSFGGRIAIKGYATKTLTFKKMVLTGSAGLKPKNSIKKRVKKCCFNIAKHILPKEKLEVFYSKDYLSLDHIMKKSFIKIVNEHLDDYLEKIDCPTLIINGQKDKQTPLYMAKKLNQNILNSTLSIYEECGHFCFLDKPNKFNMEVKEFLLS